MVGCHINNKIFEYIHIVTLTINLVVVSQRYVENKSKAETWRTE